MSNTYTQIHIQFIFAVKYRAAIIKTTWQSQLHQYISGIFSNNNHKIIAVNSVSDHIHLFAGVRPHQSVSSLIQNVKAESTKWINDKKFCKGKFLWQEGYGAFSYSKSQIPVVARYIANQQKHHQTTPFLTESNPSSRPLTFLMTKNTFSNH